MLCFVKNRLVVFGDDFGGKEMEQANDDDSKRHPIEASIQRHTQHGSNER